MPEEQEGKIAKRVSEAMDKALGKWSAEQAKSSADQAEATRLLLAYLQGKSPGAPAAPAQAEEQQPAKAADPGPKKAPEAAPAPAAAKAPTPRERPPARGVLELSSREGPKEEVLLRQALGIATIATSDGVNRFALFHADLWTLDGKWDGTVETVIQLEVGVKQEYTFPERQPGPYDAPGPIQPTSMLNQNRAKTKYTFADESTIESVGTAVGYRVPMKDGSFQIVVALTESISHGTHLYHGVKGLTTFVGGTWFPATPAFNPGERSEHRSFHVIRLFRKLVQGEVPPEAR